MTFLKFYFHFVINGKRKIRLCRGSYIQAYDELIRRFPKSDIKEYFPKENI